MVLADMDFSAFFRSTRSGHNDMINTYEVIPKYLNPPSVNLLSKFAGNRSLDMKI